MAQSSPLIKLLRTFLPVGFEERQAVQVILQLVLETQARTTFWSLVVGQLTIQENLGDALVAHADNVARPTELIFQQVRLNAANLAACKYLMICDLVLPANVAN